MLPICTSRFLADGRFHTSFWLNSRAPHRRQFASSILDFFRYMIATCRGSFEAVDLPRRRWRCPPPRCLFCNIPRRFACGADASPPMATRLRPLRGYGGCSRRPRRQEWLQQIRPPRWPGVTMTLRPFYRRSDDGAFASRLMGPRQRDFFLLEGRRHYARLRHDI